MTGLKNKKNDKCNKYKLKYVECSTNWTYKAYISNSSNELKDVYFNLTH